MDHAGHEALERTLVWLRERLASCVDGVARYDALWLHEAVMVGREGVLRRAPEKRGLVEAKAEAEAMLESEAAQ